MVVWLGFFFSLFSTKVPRLATSAPRGALLQDNVAELEIGRATGQQTENAFVPSSYEAKELYQPMGTACAVTALAREVERKVAQP